MNPMVVYHSVLCSAFGLMCGVLLTGWLYGRKIDWADWVGLGGVAFAVILNTIMRAVQ